MKTAIKALEWLIVGFLWLIILGIWLFLICICGAVAFLAASHDGLTGEAVMAGLAALLIAGSPLIVVYGRKSVGRYIDGIDADLIVAGVSPETVQRLRRQREAEGEEG